MKNIFQKWKYVGMAVPKTTQTRYMDGSVQRTTQVTPSVHLFFIFFLHKDVSSNLTTKFRYTFYSKKERCRDGVTCVVLCTLPSIYLVCVVFGTAIPPYFYIFGKCFSYLFACIFLLYYSTIQEVVLLYQHLPPRTGKIRLACEAKYVSWDHTRK